MNITIGEIINDILPYTNTIEIKSHGYFPFIHAVMGNGKLMARFDLYVVQIRENEYAVCDTVDIINSERYIPTRDSNKPLISEKEFISNWLLQTKNIVDSSVVNHLTHYKFIDYIIDRLSYHDVIKFNPDYYNKHISDFISSGTKHKKQIIKVFHDNGCKSDTVKDLIDIVYKQKREINLNGLKQKNITYIISKLMRIGLIITNKDNVIQNIDFERSV